MTDNRTNIQRSHTIYVYSQVSNRRVYPLINFQENFQLPCFFIYTNDFFPSYPLLLQPTLLLETCHLRDLKLIQLRILKYFGCLGLQLLLDFSSARNLFQWPLLEIPLTATSYAELLLLSIMISKNQNRNQQTSWRLRIKNLPEWIQGI